MFHIVGFGIKLGNHTIPILRTPYDPNTSMHLSVMSHMSYGKGNLVDAWSTGAIYVTFQRKCTMMASRQDHCHLSCLRLGCLNTITVSNRY